jgi:4-diphosphocytidyl-2-C-methyl-D-erythritol kinase
MKLRALAPAKVNLCLFLGGTREDGRHELVTVFESVSLADELLLETLPGGHDEVYAPGVEGPNLVAHALARLRARDWPGAAVRIEIEKRIPIAAGMGGGSADTAAALRMVPEVSPVEPATIAELAAELGADVPSQLEPGVVLGTGAGELVEPLADLAAHAFVIVPLPFALPTPDVYAEADRLGLGRDPGELRARLEELRAALEPGALLPDALLVNDLEPAAVSLCPPVAGALDAVRAIGADVALVCGSGPTVAGLFWGEDPGYRAEEAAVALHDRFPRASAAIPVDAEFALPQIA